MTALDVVPIRRALVSVSDKTGLADLGRALAARKVEVLSTGGTAKALREAGCAVKEVAEFTGFTEMLDGRVKTLHPKIHGGLLGRRDDPKHLAQMEQHGIVPIDLVVVNLYPFEKIAGQADAHWDELIENIDIGGPSMLRSAAKNHDAVAVVCDPSDYPELLAALDVAGGTTLSERRKWALKVYARTASYDGAIAARLALKVETEMGADAEPCVKAGLGQVLAIVGARTSSLRYGENPHQLAAVYTTSGEALDLAGAVPLQGKELSYNNLLDADAATFALKCLTEGDARPAAAIIKHNTPCGAARGVSLIEAWKRALAGDPVSAFGGIVAFSHPVDGETAMAMAEVFLEVIVAPGFTAEARAAFAKKSALRLLEIANLASAPLPRLAFRSIAGGLLVQEHDRPTVNVREGKVVTRRAPTDAEWAALDLAFRLCAPVKSNAITLVKDDMLLAAGGGQTSRVDSAKIAVAKAAEHKHDVRGAALGSDAFFPFADGLQVGIDAGVTAVAQPCGSKRDDEVIKAADAAGIAMVFTGRRHFRH
ncbi:MAG: bifunctional phosphoribosylaminoimidazolecarboxamide formyltransferase/IMP cyclohydrolase [Deltaproteobacteria bacterium RBG_16_71_12]|nr:MAG: bifunctional phosphoribosylaminoimidazolecarboxamide formyltransferase/IMP cyclohydrolase [Deltaproteobacteria bacterium RBG_16_71_12]